MHRRLFVSATVAVALLVLGAPAVSAFPPIHDTWEEQGTDTLAAGTLCPFDVAIDYHVTGDITIFLDPTGTYWARSVEQDVGQDSFAANGNTLVGEPYRFNGMMTFDANGDITSAVITGGIERVPLPGGKVFWSVGRFDLFAHDFVGAIVPDQGHSGDVDAFCAALAP